MISLLFSPHDQLRIKASQISSYWRFTLTTTYVNRQYAYIAITHRHTKIHTAYTTTTCKEISQM